MLKPALVTFVAVASLLALAVPGLAITGGTEDTANKYSNVGVLVFYQPDGRFRCTATLIAPRVLLTAAHCAFQDIGKVIVSFDPLISRTEDEAEVDIPRAADDSGPDDAVSAIGYTASDVTAPKYQGEQTWFLGTAYTHPDYSDFTDRKNWNDTGAVVLDQAPGLPTTPIAPANFLDAHDQPLLNKTAFLTIGYGTEVRKPETTPRKPVPEREPIVRRSTTEIGRKMTAQLLQTQGNINDPRAGGGTCFGDSGGPIELGGFIVGDTSYGNTLNCRYINGYQRVDIPIVRDWVMSCVVALTCESKQ
jgi:secreted trypsin-like serine protease